MKNALCVIGFAAMFLSVFNAEGSEVKWFSVSEATWKIRTDKTERPDVGQSTLMATYGKAVDAEGLLYSLPGKKGPVGFALIEADEDFDTSSYNELCFDFSGRPTGAHYQVLLKDDQSDQPQGTLTFQVDFVAASPERQTRCFSLSAFTPTIRGTPVPDFVLNRKAVIGFSVQISRSSQTPPLLAVSPLTFAFTLSGDIRFRR